MKNNIEERLKQLQNEYEAGQKMLADLDAKRQSLTATLLRIEGAMQVLREMIEPQAEFQDDDSSSAPPVA